MPIITTFFYFFPDIFTEDWDTGNVKKFLAWPPETKNPPGAHRFCDGNGNPLKLNEVKSGMRVKLKARNVHFEGWEYLYSSEGRWGKYK